MSFKRLLRLALVVIVTATTEGCSSSPPTQQVWVSRVSPPYKPNETQIEFEFPFEYRLPNNTPTVGVYLLVDESDSARYNEETGSDPECRHDIARFLLSLSQIAHDVKYKHWYDTQPQQVPWLGLAYFAYEAEVVLPLERAETKAEDYLEKSKLDSPPQPGGNGTRYVEALNVASAEFTRAEATSGIDFDTKAIVLLTDGRLERVGYKRIEDVLTSLTDEGYYIYIVLTADISKLQLEDRDFWLRMDRNKEQIELLEAAEKEGHRQCFEVLEKLTEDLFGDWLNDLFSSGSGGGWGWIKPDQELSIQPPRSGARIYLAAISLSNERPYLNDGREIRPSGLEQELKVRNQVENCERSSKHNVIVQSKEIALYWWHNLRPFIKVTAQVPQIVNNNNTKVRVNAELENVDLNVLECYRVAISVGSNNKEVGSLAEIFRLKEETEIDFVGFDFEKEQSVPIAITITDVTTGEEFSETGTTSAIFIPDVAEEAKRWSSSASGKEYIHIEVTVHYGDPSLYEKPDSANPSFLMPNSEVSSQETLVEWQEEVQQEGIECPSPEERDGWAYRLSSDEIERKVDDEGNAVYTLKIQMPKKCERYYKKLYIEWKWPNYDLKWALSWDES